jgi:hypothetical protein
MMELISTRRLFKISVWTRQELYESRITAI